MAKSSKSRPTSRSKRPAPLEGNQVWKDRSRVRKAGPTTRETSWWESTPEWVQHAACIGFLFIVAVGFYAPTTFGGKTLAAGDTVQWRATAQAMMEYEEQTGQAALWAPNTFGGMPGYLISYPTRVPGPDTIVSWLRGLGLWPAAHFFTLLLGTYFLVLLLTRSKPAGVLGAVAYGLTTYLPIIVGAGHNTKFVALAYAPWLLLGFAALIRREPNTSALKSVFLTLLFAIAAAVNLRAGHIQITYYVVIVAGIWWIAEGVAAAKGHQTKTFAISTGLLVVGSVLALAMVAQPYLAQWEYKAFTIRSSGPGGGLAWDYAMEWSQGIGELLTLLIADSFGGGKFYWGPKPFTAGPHYVGPIVILLALVGTIGVARRSVVAFAVAAFVMTLFSLGEYLPIVNQPAFDFLPLFSSFRVPETWLSVVALMLALLAGWGAYFVQRIEATHDAEDRKRRVVLGVLGVLVVFVGGLWMTGGAGLSFEKPGEQEQIQMAAAQQFQLSPDAPEVIQAATQFVADQRASRAEVFSADAGRTFLFLLLAGGLLALLLWRKIPGWVALSGLALLVTIDLWGVGRRYFNEDIPSLQRRASVAAAIPSSGADDFIRAQVDEAGGPGHFRVLPQNPLANAQPSYFYESVGGYNAARLALIQTYFDDILPDDSTGLNANALRVLSVRFVMSPQPLPGLRIATSDPASGALVLEDTLSPKRAHFVDTVESIPDDVAAIARLRSSGLDLNHTALVSGPVPEGLGAAPTPADSASAPQASMDRFAPDEIVWTVETDRPRLLVISELYYPKGWVARIDNEETPILRTNYLTRGVVVPEGEHIVSMTFEPESHTLGLRIAWGSALLVYLSTLLSGGVLWYRRGHPAT